ncbi:AP2 domain-containing protein [Lacticaseibacillus absianus]|uniref:AP2 domain-containing protein n=1 Tax=Lacticaseibacillus absianus TaxID=2729623 RepID=UPI0015C936D9|nr:AP2 domain-containing protein [Lacticaseibacillus absianus]
MNNRKQLIDLTGQRFGRLTVLGRAKQRSANRNARWECLCDCGKHKVVEGYHLRHGLVASCGCLRVETSRKMAAQALLPYADHDGSAFKNEAGVYYSSLIRSKRNRSGTIGVSYDHQKERWVARLRFHGEYVLNKTTKTREQAIALRQQALSARRLAGQKHQSLECVNLARRSGDDARHGAVL